MMSSNMVLIFSGIFAAFQIFIPIGVSPLYLCSLQIHYLIILIWGIFKTRFILQMIRQLNVSSIHPSLIKIKNQGIQSVHGFERGAKIHVKNYNCCKHQCLVHCSRSCLCNFRFMYTTNNPIPLFVVACRTRIYFINSRPISYVRLVGGL